MAEAVPLYDPSHWYVYGGTPPDAPESFIIIDCPRLIVPLFFLLTEATGSGIIREFAWVIVLVELVRLAIGIVVVFSVFVLSVVEFRIDKVDVVLVEVDDEVEFVSGREFVESEFVTIVEFVEEVVFVEEVGLVEVVELVDEVKFARIVELVNEVLAYTLEDPVEVVEVVEF